MVWAYYDMGFAYEKLEQYREALVAYKEYLAAYKNYIDIEPTGEYADSAREGIRRLSRKLRDDINPRTQPADE